MVNAEGIAVSGEMVKNLNDKRFAVGSKPRYEEIPNIDDPSKTNRRVVMSIILYSDRSVLDYYPNKTSVRTMVNLWGVDMDNWLGKLFEWEVIEQKFKGLSKPVLYVKPIKLEIEPFK